MPRRHTWLRIGITAWVCMLWKGVTSTIASGCTTGGMGIGSALDGRMALGSLSRRPACRLVYVIATDYLVLV